MTRCSMLDSEEREGSQPRQLIREVRPVLGARSGRYGLVPDVHEQERDLLTVS